MIQNYIYASFNNSNYFSYYSDGLGVHANTEGLTSNDTYTFAGTGYNGVWRRFLPGITPVELVTLTALRKDNNVTLSWQTATEKNNSGFEIQRSDVRDQKSETLDWKNIGFIKGHGTTTKENNYSFVDKNLGTGSYSYKLFQIDFDETRTESEIVNVNINSQPKEYALMQNYPNPFNPTTTIEYSIPENGNVKLKIYNSLGEEVATLVNEYKTVGNLKFNFDASALPSGIYFYRINANNFSSVKKLILLK